MEIQGEIPFPYQVQPGRTITERDDGTLHSAVMFKTKEEWVDFLPEEGATHPDDRRLELFTREITRTTLGHVEMVGHFLGLKDDPTDKVISYTGPPDRERIETHPDFNDMAGTAESPQNGALWWDQLRNGPADATSDSNYTTFRGFVSNTNAEVYGVEYYLKPSTQVNLTWWQTDVPKVERMVIVDDIKPFPKPDGVENFLLVDTPFRQVGAHYQVTQILLGSGSGGWSETIYPQE